MTQTKKRTLLWLAAGCVFSLLVLLIVSGGLSGNVLVTDPEGIPEAVDSVMNSTRTGDWKGLEQMISGNPSLSPETGKEDSAERIIWQAYLESLQWVCDEEFSVQGPCVSQQVTVTCLDISSITDAMAGILAESDPSAPENKAKLLGAAAEQVLQEDAPVLERKLTLTFHRKKGQWLLIPDSAFQALLSGFTAH